MAGKRKYDRAEMRRLYDLGMRDKEIADKIGCSEYYVTDLRENAKLPPNPEPFDEGKMKALYRAGWSIHKIADEMRVEDSEIRRRLNE